MKKETITTLFITIIFQLVALTANAQAYEYDYSEDDGFLSCVTTDSYSISNDEGIIMLSLETMKGMTCSIGIATTYQELMYLDTEKDMDFSIQIKLSNGDILRSMDRNCTFDFIWWYVGSAYMSINNIIRENCEFHVMSLLRTYDIVSFTIEDITVKTPGLHSADTFDAMCKTLASKTGDQGQYGKRLSGGNNKNNTNKNNKNTNNNSPKPAPKIEKFNSTNPVINIAQFVRYPFGLAALDKEGVSEQEFFNEMRNNLPKMKETPSPIISHYYDYGKENDIPLAYKGKDINLAAAYFDETNGNPLRQYIYTFTFDKKIYEKDDIIQFFNQILSDLNSNGVTMERNGNLENFGEVKGKINGNDVLLSSSDISTYDYEVRIIVTKPFLTKRK